MSEQGSPPRSDPHPWPPEPPPPDLRAGDRTWDGAGYPPAPPPGYPPPGSPPPGHPPAGAPYPPPYPGAALYGYPPARRTNSNALVALILGIAGLVVCQPLGLVAFFLGRTARKEIAASHGAEEGDGMALAGQIIGLISFGVFVLSILLGGVIILVALIAAAASGGSSAGGGLSV